MIITIIIIIINTKSGACGTYERGKVIGLWWRNMKDNDLKT
jgi:hypothetical protein